MEANFSLIERLVWKYAGQHVVGEYRFHPAREWRFDFAIPDCRVAIEVEGGAFIGGRTAICAIWRNTTRRLPADGLSCVSCRPNYSAHARSGWW